MIERTCGACHGRGTVRDGSVVGPVDPAFDTSKSQSSNAARGLALLALVEIGDRIACYDFTYEVVNVGMYDGWPYWKPMPAAQTRSPLGGGGGDWRFYYDVTGVKKRGTDVWIHEAPEPSSMGQEAGQ